MRGVSQDVIWVQSQIHVISSEHRTCTRSDPSVRVMPGGEACAGFVTVTVESERPWGVSLVRALDLEGYGARAPRAFAMSGRTRDKLAVLDRRHHAAKPLADPAERRLVLDHTATIL
jgi:hypothetical protein